jgi:hypothetical protein
MDYGAIGTLIHDNVSVSTAITILELTAPSTRTLEIFEIWVDFSTTTSAAQRVNILRKSATITGTGVTPAAMTASAVSATGKRTATGEGTDGTILYQRIINQLNGFYWLPVPEQRIVVPPSGIIAIKFPTAPGAAVSVTAGFTWGEIG